VPCVVKGDDLVDELDGGELAALGVANKVRQPGPGPTATRKKPPWPPLIGCSLESSAYTTLTGSPSRGAFHEASRTAAMGRRPSGLAVLPPRGIVRGVRRLPHKIGNGAWLARALAASDRGRGRRCLASVSVSGEPSQQGVMVPGKRSRQG
jgi:hypothetical protein